MDILQKELCKARRNSEVMQAFGQHLTNRYAAYKSYRRSKELEWLQDLRQYKGIYDPDVTIDPANSKIYPKITRSKVNIALSRLHEMLFPETDRNWGLEPSPEPKMSKEIVRAIAMAMVTQDEQGNPVPPSIPDLREAIHEYAEDACSLMATEIEDQLLEMEYPEETKKVLRSGLMYGTGIMKGPLVDTRTKRIWAPTPDGDYEEEEEKEEIPRFEFVRLWDWYPDMSTPDIKTIEGSFERHVMTKHDLRELMKREEFFDDLIEQYLVDNPNGTYIPENWETDLQQIQLLSGVVTEGSTQYPLSDLGSNHPYGDKYEVAEFWGYVDGKDLEACGLEVPDPRLEYAANVWLLPAVGQGAGRPVKVALYPGALREYKLFYFEKDETSIFGEGLPRVMRHSQAAIAAAARMVLDNGACVAGPQVEVNVSLLADDTDLNSFYPRKIWFRKGKGIDAQYEAIRGLNFESHIEELIMIIDLFKKFGDEETCLPTWFIGDQVNNETAQATSSRQGTVLVSIKDVVKNFDAFTTAVIGDLYAWNMTFNPRKELKGDYQCKATGVASLVMKEIRMQALSQLSTTLTPEERDYIPEREFIEAKFKAFDLDVKLLTDEQVQKKREERSQSMENQLALKMADAEIKYKQAQTMAQVTKAKKVNVEAIKDAQTPPEMPAGDDPRLTDAELALKGTEIAGKEAEIRRKEEAHAHDLAHKDEKHRVDVDTKMVQTAHGIAEEEKNAEHGRKMKEISTNAAAKAKKESAKAKKQPKKE